MLSQLVKRMKVADVMTRLGSIDINMGQVDRKNPRCPFFFRLETFKEIYG